MANTKTSDETTQSSTDGDEYVRVSEPQGTSPQTYANKKTTVNAIGHRFIGALVGLTATTAAKNLTTNYEITDWDKEEYDTHAMWAASPNPERIYVPSGIGAIKAQATISLRVNPLTADNYCFVAIGYYNSSDVLTYYLKHEAETGDANAWISWSTPVLPVEEGGYFVAYVIVESDTSASIFDVSLFGVEIKHCTPV